MKKLILTILIISIIIVINEQKSGKHYTPPKCDPQIVMKKVEVEVIKEVPKEIVKKVYTDESCKVAQLLPECAFIDGCFVVNDGLNCPGVVSEVMPKVGICLKKIFNLRKEQK